MYRGKQKKINLVPSKLTLKIRMIHFRLFLEHKGKRGKKRQQTNPPKTKQKPQAKPKPNQPSHIVT